MSVGFSLLISSTRLEVAMRSHDAGRRRRSGLEYPDEFDELPLRLRRIHSLMCGNKIGNGALRLQRDQRLGHALVVDRGEEERCIDLAGFHVSREILCVTGP